MHLLLLLQPAQGVPQLWLMASGMASVMAQHPGPSARSYAVTVIMAP
jgi:hypothetical protein